MINLCIADNYPIVHFGFKSYFKNHQKINVVSNLSNFYQVADTLRKQNIDVPLIDIELEGLKSISSLRSIVKDFPNTKIIVFSSQPENVYASSVIKVGCSGYIHKSLRLERFEAIIIKLIAEKLF